MTALSGQLKTQGTLAATPGKFEPSYGPHSGGTRTSITGNGFTGANGANFGVTPAANFEFVNDGLIRANSPPAPDGVDEAKVILVFPGSSPPNREVGTFYYYTIDPCHGGEGQTVTIRGSGLKDVNAVKFGKKEVAVPADSKGTRELKIQTPSRQEAGNANEVDVTLIFPVESPTNFSV
jgi:IPT/TIG domain-containing protein